MIDHQILPFLQSETVPKSLAVHGPTGYCSQTKSFTSQADVLRDITCINGCEYVSAIVTSSELVKIADYDKEDWSIGNSRLRTSYSGTKILVRDFLKGVFMGVVEICTVSAAYIDIFFLRIDSGWSRPPSVRSVDTLGCPEKLG